MDTTTLFTIAISTQYRGTQKIYAAQALACNGEKLYQPEEGLTISQAVEQVVEQIRQAEHLSAVSK